MAYRVKQFACAFATRLRPQERTEVENLLNPDELALFYGMSRPALHHSLRVFRKLRMECPDDAQLLAAALLHDVGKGRMSIAHRVAVVLLEASRPDVLEAIASREGPGWRRGFYEHQHHPDLGAEMVRRAGSGQRVVELIRHHHTADLDGLLGLASLRMADEGS